MYAIAGVTGNTGSAAAEALLSRGEEVRVIVRSEEKGAPWAARGAEVAVADLGDGDALARALEGARGAYLLVPPDAAADDVLASRRPIAEAIAEALRRARLERVVLLSSIGAQHPTGTGPIRIVHHLETLTADIPGVTALRAAYFLDNWAGMLPVAKGDGVLPTFMPPEVAMPMASTVDIGRTAADLLTQSEAPPRIVELAGPREVSAADVAGAAAKVFDRPVTAHHLPLDQLVGAMTEAGLGQNMAELYLELHEGAFAGLLEWTGAEQRRGSESLEDGVRRLAG